MWLWAVIIVSGICTFFGFYMTFLAYRLGDKGVFLFSGFGLFFGILFTVSVIHGVARRSAFFKRISDTMAGKPKPVTFVPHWFMMGALIATVVAILAAILIPVIFR